MLVTCCTGLYAPGLDFDIRRPPGAGYDGGADDDRVHGLLCGDQRAEAGAAYCAVGAEPKVLMVNLELCTLHLQETQELEQVLSFLVFARWLLRRA